MRDRRMAITAAALSMGMFADALSLERPIEIKLPPREPDAPTIKPTITNRRGRSKYDGAALREIRKTHR